MVPIEVVADIRNELGADLVFRYNQFLTAAINGSPTAGQVDWPGDGGDGTCCQGRTAGGLLV
jgi:hypothetical protein